MLSVVIEPALEVARLVGAESEEDLTGIGGGKSIVNSSPSVNEKARGRQDGRSNTGPLLALFGGTSSPFVKEKARGRQEGR